MKTITVQDTNQRPVADFSWEPAEGIVAGDEVQFTDKSRDPDGSIVSWEWKIGSNTVTEQNPKFTFNEFGDIEVTLTVTDNQRGKGSVKKTVHVAKSPNSLELVWAQAYDSDAEAYTKFTSPATNLDGSVVYAFSSGLHLVAFDPDGNQKWSFDANLHNPNPRSNDGTKTGSSCTPSVDKDGTIFIALAYNESGGTDDNESGVYAVNPDGTQKWYFPWRNAKYINVIPVILDEKIFLATKVVRYPVRPALSGRFPPIPDPAGGFVRPEPAPGRGRERERRNRKSAHPEQRHHHPEQPDDLHGHRPGEHGLCPVRQVQRRPGRPVLL